MAILSKKLRRDLFYNKGRSLSVIIIVLISTSLYAGLIQSWVNITATFDDVAEETNLESVRFSLGAVNQSSVDLSRISGIQAWDTRLTVVTSVSLQNSDTKYTGVIYGVDKAQRPKANDFLIVDGKYFDDTSENDILLTSVFMKSNDLQLEDEISIITPFGSKSFEITAEIFSSEFTYNVNPKSGLPDLQGLAAGWTPLDYLQEQFGVEGKINEVIVRFTESITTDEATTDVKIEEVRQELLKLTPQVSFTTLENELNEQMKDADVNALGDFARIFGLVILFLALFAIWDNISKLIASQRNYIGTMRALGGSKSRVTAHYTMMSVVLGLIAMVLSIPTGYLLSDILGTEYVALLGIPRLNRDFVYFAFIEAILVNYSLVILFGFLASIAASRIEPREAMSSSYISMIFSKRPIIEKLFTKVPIFNTPTTIMPLRGLFANRKKTTITIFTYAASLVLMIAALGFTDSFNGAITNNYEEYEKYDMQAYFLQPLAPDYISTQMNLIDGWKSYETFVSNPIEIELENDKTQATTLFAYESSSNLRELNIAEKDGDGVIIGQILSEDTGVQIGDEIEFLNETYRVAGIAAEMMTDGVFVEMEVAQTLLGLQSNVTGLLLELEEDYAQKDLQNDLLESPMGIGLILSSDDIQESINALMQGLMAFVGVMIFIGFITVALFSFNTVVLDVMTREMEFVNLRSLGAQKRKIWKIVLSQSLFIIVFGSILAVPMSYLVTDAVNVGLTEGLMVIETIIHPESYLIAIVSAFIASMFGVYSAVRYVNKINLVDALRKRVNS